MRTSKVPAFVLSALVGWGAISSIASATSYLPGPLSTVGPIQHQTVESLPSPQSRTDIGIGEDVTCWIDPSTWSDTDYIVGDPNTSVSDSMGTVTWSVSGPGSVYPLTGNTTTVTADLADRDGSITVQASVADSGTEGIDPLINLNVALAANVPDGCNATWVSDNALGLAGPPNNQIGGSLKTNVQVTPANVNFSKVQFRENIPANNWNWNDGTPDVFGPKIVTYMVKTIGGQNNMSTDTAQIKLRPIARINGAAQTVTWNVPQEYQDKAGAWNQFKAETHDHAFTAAGACTVTVNMSNNVSSKAAQGPWQ